MRLNDILDTVQSYAPDADVDTVMRAYVYSARAHAGQTRKSGEPYLTHPIAVAGLLAELRMDVDTIAVGLLHDTMEDCLATRTEISDQFGPEVAEMVSGVTKIGKLNFRSKQEAQAENFRKLVLAMSKDVRVILVKLCDRLHNMRTMQHMKPDRQAAISQETMDIFAPIANRLGLSKLKSELEDLCFRYLHPEVFEGLEGKLGEDRQDREAWITTTTSEIRESLHSRSLSCEVKGRPKHLWSIYQKMRRGNLALDQIHDRDAFRVFVDDVGQCYTALGLIHASYRHLPERLKDYIANPKSNGYQSLHTVVLGPEGRQIEIQIRTHEMHRIAEYGIAAHWRYKEGHLALSRDDLGKIARLRELFEAAKDIDDSTEFFETIKVDLFSDEIFVFTPRGDVKFLPAGATVLDFAYAIHTQVGATTTGALVNGRMVPLRHELQGGDTCEIIRRPDQKPSRPWLEWAKTGRALSKIRRQIREEEREKYIETGRQLLENELRKRGHNHNRMLRAGKIKEVAEKFGHNGKVELLYHALAQGNVQLRKVLAELVPAEQVEPPEERSESPLATLINRLRRRSESPVLINGESDVLTNYAKCCAPLPGEPVVGYITRGRGITVHHQSCTTVMNLDQERRVPVQWHRGAKGVHSGELRIVCSDEPGLLADIGAACKTAEVNVTRMEAKGIDDHKALFTLEVTVSDVAQLTRLMRNIEKINDVISVDRVRDHVGV